MRTKILDFYPNKRADQMGMVSLIAGFDDLSFDEHLFHYSECEISQGNHNPSAFILEYLKGTNENWMNDINMREQGQKRKVQEISLQDFYQREKNGWENVSKWDGSLRSRIYRASTIKKREGKKVLDVLESDLTNLEKETILSLINDGTEENLKFLITMALAVATTQQGFAIKKRDDYHSFKKRLEKKFPGRLGIMIEEQYSKLKYTLDKNPLEIDKGILYTATLIKRSIEPTDEEILEMTKSMLIQSGKKVTPKNIKETMPRVRRYIMSGSFGGRVLADLNKSKF
jgi:hypothetical protein